MKNKKCTNCGTIYDSAYTKCPCCKNEKSIETEEKKTLLLPLKKCFPIVNLYTITSVLMFYIISVSTKKSGFWSAWIVAVVFGIVGILIFLTNLRELPTIKKAQKYLNVYINLLGYVAYNGDYNLMKIVPIKSSRKHYAYLVVLP